MELKLNYFDEFQQLSSSQLFTDRPGTTWNLPLVKNAQIYGDTTLYLHDITDWNVPGKTLVIDKERPPYTTNWTSRKLIRDFLRPKPCRDIFIRMMADHLDISHSRPIVYGTFRLVPLCGTTRGSADWVFAHHLKDLYSTDGNVNSSLLNFDNEGLSIQLQVPYTEAAVYNKLARAQCISEVTYRIMQSFADLFGMTVIKPKEEVICQIDERFKAHEKLDMSVNETVIDLTANLFTISSEVLLGGPVISKNAAKKLLMNPKYDLWRLY